MKFRKSFFRALGEELDCTDAELAKVIGYSRPRYSQVKTRTAGTAEKLPRAVLLKLFRHSKLPKERFLELLLELGDDD